MKKTISKMLTACLAMLLGVSCTSPDASARSEYWHQRVTLFDSIPVEPGDIVFLGNSITDGGEFQELLGVENVKNRGIQGDVVDGVLERLSQVTKGTPSKIFLLIGINDVSHAISAQKIASRYEELVKRIRKETPSTTLYIESVMPVNNDFRRYKNLIGREKVIPELNALLQDIAADNGCVYIDLWPVFADEQGKMKREYTNDGLHLLGAGYKAWAEALRPYVEEEHPLVKLPDSAGNQ